MVCFSLWFWLWCAFYNRSLKKHIILLSKCISRLANKRIHIKLVSSVFFVCLLFVVLFCFVLFFVLLCFLFCFVFCLCFCFLSFGIVQKETGSVFMLFFFSVFNNFNTQVCFMVFWLLFLNESQKHMVFKLLRMYNYTHTLQNLTISPFLMILKTDKVNPLEPAQSLLRSHSILLSFQEGTIFNVPQCWLSEMFHTNALIRLIQQGIVLDSSLEYLRMLNLLNIFIRKQVYWQLTDVYQEVQL